MKRDESGGMRLMRFRDKMRIIRNAAGIDLVVFEAARHAGKFGIGALTVQAEIQGVLKLLCEEWDLQFKGYSPNEIKKHATGKGNSGKPEMIKAAEAKWGRVFTDDNEADALWLLDLAKMTFDA